MEEIRECKSGKQAKKKTPLNIQSNANKKNNLFLCIFFVILASTYCKATPENFSLIFCIIKN